jgi:hypothetical protein
LPLVLPLLPVASLPFDEPIELSSVRFGIVVKPDELPFSVELIEDEPIWPSEREMSFERQACVPPFGEYSAALPGAGAGAGGIGAGVGAGAMFGAGVGIAPGAPQLGATVAPQPQLGVTAPHPQLGAACPQPQVGAGAQPQAGWQQWWW